MTQEERWEQFAALIEENETCKAHDVLQEIMNVSNNDLAQKARRLMQERRNKNG